MYQGEVNVKHTELQAFMKIAEMLQIKGLTSPNNKFSSPAIQRGGRQSPHKSTDSLSPSPSSADVKTSNVYGSTSGQLGSTKSLVENVGTSQKRPNDFVACSDAYPTNFVKKQAKRSITDINESSSGTQDNMTNDSMDNMQEEVFMPIPQISMIEQQSHERFDVNNVKRENLDMPNSPQQHQRSGANSSNASFSYDYQNNSNSGGPFKMEFNSENPHPGMNDFNNKGSHMDIPPGMTF